MFITELMIISIACCLGKDVAADNRFNQTRNSSLPDNRFNQTRNSSLAIIYRGNLLLPSMDQARSRNESEFLFGICQRIKNSFIVYDKMIYFRFCDNNDKFDQFCDDIEMYYSNNYTMDVLQAIRTTAKEEGLFGFGIESDYIWEAEMTCRSFRNYFQEKYALQNGANNLRSGVWPNYAEWSVYGIPFCREVVCGFTEHVLSSQTPHPIAIDCIPPSCRVGFIILYCIDVLIIVATFLANLFIVILTPKTKIATTPHG